MPTGPRPNAARATARSAIARQMRRPLQPSHVFELGAPGCAGSPGAGAGRLARFVARGSSGLTALALLTGVGAGLGAVAFRYMILGFTHVFTGHRDYSAVGPCRQPAGAGAWGSGSWCSRRSSAV